MIARRLSVAALLLALARPAVADVASMRADFDRAIDAALAERRVVGLVAIAAVDGKVVYERAAGLADREAERPIRFDTLFRLASVSKPVVTAAALALVDAGKLGLDEPVTKYLSDFRPRLADGREPAITVRQLMTHTAGLTYTFDGGPEGVSSGLDQPGLSMADEISRIAKVPLAVEPGTRWQYSNAIDVLGAVCEKAAGESLDTLVGRYVRTPLRVPELTFSIDARQADRVATPYANRPGLPPARIEDGDVENGIRYEPRRVFDAKSFPSGGAGMVGSARGVYALLETIRAGGRTMLKPETARSMFANQIGDLRSGPGMGFGFGGAVVIDPAAARVPLSAGSWTWGGVYGHAWYVDPTRKLTLVLLTNTTPEGMAGTLPNALRDAACAAIPAAD